MIRAGAFGRGQQWHALIATLEDSLRLHHHRPDTLVELADYLHNRSNGMIGSLLRLIRAAAVQAVLDGSETITRATLEPGDQPRGARLERLQDRPPPRPRPQDSPCLPQRQTGPRTATRARGLLRPVRRLRRTPGR